MYNLVLFKRSHFQIVDLLLGEVTPTAAGKVFLCESGKINAVELCHMISERLEDAAYDAVA